MNRGGHNVQGYTSPNRRHDRRFFYKYMPPDTAKIVLCNRTLRWSSPILFNDPFDNHPDPMQFSSIDMQRAVVAELSSLLTNPGDTSVTDPLLQYMLEVARRSTPQERMAMAAVPKEFETLLSDQKSDSLQDLKLLWSDMLRDMRVLCLSEVNDLTAMWEHYAAKATGVVVKFEAVDRLDSAFLMARPVKYDDSPPAISQPQEWARMMIYSNNVETEGVHLFDDYEHTKTTEWQAEREWRISSRKRREESGLYSDYGFKAREVAAVYFGWKCSEEDREAITALLAHGLDHVETFRAYPEPNTRRYAFERPSRV